MTLQPGGRLGSYEIVEKIGAGGMGAVYKGYQTALGRYVAIKVLPPQTAGDPAFGERFAQEARAIGKLRHPNIVTAFDFAHEGDIAYLVSEFIDGGTLADQLGTPLPLDYAIGILTPIAGALDYAHARGIVHRDIKPQNILLTHDGQPVLTDFGLAKIVGPGSGMTQAGSLMGTAEYIAPECASGAEVAGPAADQYALGLIAYQLLTGRHPFPADNPLSALMAHVHKPVPLPSSLGVALPPGVEAALLRSLAKRPEERFPRSSDLVRALSGSTFTGMGTTPASASASNPPSTAPSQPPTIPPTATTAPSPLLSPSALVRPPERAASTPPAAATTAAATSVAAKTLVSGGGGAAAGTATTAPIALAKKTPWWRRRRMLVLPAALIVLAILSLPKQEQRASATSAPPTRTPARTAPVGGGTTATPVATQTIVATPTPAPTVARTATPEPAPTFNYGHTPQTATAITPGVFNGDLTTAGEVDYFRFDARANAQIIVEFKGSTLSGGAAALLVQTAANGSLTQLAEDIDSGTGAKISFTTTQVGVYYVRVRSARGDTGAYSFGLVTTNK
jgi:serine/threonine protein kinase